MALTEDPNKTGRNDELIPPDEDLYINKLAELLKKIVVDTYPPGRTLRDAHPKQHGTVAAQFKVEPDLPPELKVGVFAEPATYDAFVRFSSANPTVGPDIRRDVRGMGIKLLGVKGRKVIDDGRSENTHDFVLISYDVFLTKGVKEMYKFTHAYTTGMLNLFLYWFNPFNPHLRVFWNFIVPFRKATSPLDLQYYSMTPYRFGSTAVKYSAKPWSHRLSKIPVSPTDNYLMENLQLYLSNEPIHFDFMVQLRKYPDKMPIEDAGKRWSQSLSPFIKVATLVIPPQEFETAEKMDFGDDLSFNPWRCLPVHRPLGGINRARKTAYWNISKLRHERNALKEFEPTHEDFHLFWENKVKTPPSDGGYKPVKISPAEPAGWSKYVWWVKVYSYVTLIAALYGIAYAHIPPLTGHEWSLCTGPYAGWCKLAVHLFEVPIVVFNLVIAWYGLKRFSLETVIQYNSLLGFAVTFNMVFFLFETNLLMEGLLKLFPFWEIFAFASIAVILICGTIFTMVLKQMLLKLLKSFKSKPVSEY
jgi:hypothetical protein